MYRKPKFLEVLHEIRQRMARQANYDMELFTQQLRLNPIGQESSHESVPLTSKAKRRTTTAKKAKKEP